MRLRLVGLRLNCNQPQLIYWQRRMAFKLAGRKPSWLSPLGSWGVMLEHHKTFHPKPKHSDGLKKVLHLIWGQLPQDLINKAILRFTKRHRACVKGGMDQDIFLLWEQEAQLPLRNRASAMHFFVAKLLSIVVITYIHRESKKGRHHTLVHIFAKYSQILKILSLLQSVGNLQ